ncbi:MAG TPA: putative glycolipid-binding domain-containing protein [Aggregatilineales bacterium]|nr:putative glycolipid-binding domain-containing protein [Aggregatilineales bacterium]
MKRHIFWTPWEGPGLEHAQVIQNEAGVGVRSVLIGLKDDSPFEVQYQLFCDTTWATREVSLQTFDQKGISLKADGAGHWTTGAGIAIDSLEGCIDVDITASPLTNTLPIRRLGLLEAGQSAEIAVAWINAPTLTLNAVRQRYTCLGTGRYRYEGLGTGFQAEITVDEDGLVIDYPGVFRRTWAR